MPLTDSKHETLFLGRSGMLRALDCHLLYVIPVDLAYGHRQAALRDIYGTEILTLPVVPIRDRTGHMNSDAHRALHEIVARRVRAAGLDVHDIFADEDLMTEVLAASGGHVRTLFVLLRSILDRDDRLPVTKPVVDRSLRRMAADQAQPLSSADWLILDRVHETKAQANDDNGSWNRLLRSSQVLTYYDEASGYWYDRNPLLQYVNHRKRP